MITYNSSECVISKILFFLQKVFNYSSKTFMVLWGCIREVLISCRYVIKEGKKENGCLLFGLFHTAEWKSHGASLDAGPLTLYLACAVALWETAFPKVICCGGKSWAQWRQRPAGAAELGGLDMAPRLLLCSGLAIPHSAALKTWSPLPPSSSRARKSVGHPHPLIVSDF